MRNNFFLEYEASKHLELYLVSEMKIDEPFSMEQLLLDGFCMSYRIDRCTNGGGFLPDMRDDFLLTNTIENIRYFFLLTNTIENIG